MFFFLKGVHEISEPASRDLKEVHEVNGAIKELNPKESLEKGLILSL